MSNTYQSQFVRDQVAQVATAAGIKASKTAEWMHNAAAVAAMLQRDTEMNSDHLRQTLQEWAKG